ncbi:MAG TPA: methyl-accepting chemotaxis protein [Candidatus Polarisedimenticolia bacterium]|jgi:methyl-accepting chemotaxis protein
MFESWSFGKKIAAGFAAMVALSIVVSIVAVRALRQVVASKDHIITVNADNMIDAARMEAESSQAAASLRGLLMTNDETYREQHRTSNQEFQTTFERLQAKVRSPEGIHLLERITQTQADLRAAEDRLLAARGSAGGLETSNRLWHEEVRLKRPLVREALIDFSSQEQRILEEDKRLSSERASSTTGALVAIASVTVLFAGVLAFFLTRSLTRQIGAAVHRVQSSSAELQAAASQQASGSRQQATATTEVTTTIKELVSTARQIAEGAQRVTRMAEEASTAARGGDQTLQKGRDAVEGIRRQVDAIVTHMLDLGKRSQQIGGILEIINEMAEQTNILAINATIESAGAGEAGKRFSVVADEIRNLADRVGRSTREIRTLIDETRAAANTTVMATEDGSKAVDAGTRQFSEVADTFRQIVGLVESTMEALKEIELGTRQQTTAVEQVSLAITSVAQAAKESEASARQTLDTSSELASLSRDLSRIIQTRAAA